MPHYKFSDLAYNITDKKMPEPGDEKTYIGLEHLDSGSLAVTRWGGEIELKGQKLVMKKGDILFGRRNTYLRRAAIAPHDGIFSAHGMIFRPKTEVIDPDYFPFFIASDYFMNAAIRISVGSLSPTVNWKTLKELEFDIPTLEQQRESAKILKAANELKESYQTLLLKTDDLVKSQFIEMFGEPHSEFEKWETEPFGELTVSFNSKRKPVKEGDRKNIQGPYPYYGATGIVDYINDYRLDGTFLLISEDGKALEFRNYDIAFIASGKIWVNNHAHVIQCKEKVSLTYLQYYFKYLNISDWVSGIDQKKLNRSNLEIIPIMVPPKDLVGRFDEFVEQSDKSKFELKQAIESVDLLIKSMIQQELN